ncbi:fimbrillin family protein [Prevotella sp. khp7]|uniref:fimbrillin family protein n=1 Tax=Prevotella sp. khp7 TaxID=1761885 RepID=UPI0015A557D8|nr:fimbrillin family protein [Prevotella sp. khp7]
MKTNITIIVALLLFGACTSYEERRAVSPMSIQLTASVAAETLSPGNATAWSREAWKELTSRRATRGLYETAIANGEKVYVWADKGSAGTYAFLKAWTLTSDGSGGLTGSTKYYPSDGDGLTFRAVHGNFSTAPIEGTAIGTLTHTVLADQSATGNYEKSDLHYAEGSGSYETVGSAPLNFTHKLSKIEVNLTAGIGLTSSNVTNVTVKVRNVKPSITINPSTGALGSASGTATTITARHTGNGVFEAVIPPQAAPSGVLTITMGNVTVTVPNTVTTFAENAKYIYNVKCDNKDKRLNPLWYVAENNVKSYNRTTKVVTLESDPTAAGSAQCYNWYDAMGYFSKTGTSYNTYWAGDITDGTTGFKYHLPVEKELYSVIPSSVNIFNTTDFLPSGGLVDSAPTCIFGYNDVTKAGIEDWSYWSTYTTINVRYAIRFLGTPYCSVWKYQWSNRILTITAKLIDYLDKSDATLGTKLAAYMNDASFWTSVNEDEGGMQRQFYSIGYRFNSDNGGTGVADRVENGISGYYWLATKASDEDARLFFFNGGYVGISTNNMKWGFSIRLFRNEGVGEARTDPGVAFDNVTSSHLKWYITKNGKAYSTSGLANDRAGGAVGFICYTGAVSNYFSKFFALALHDAYADRRSWADANTAVNTFAASNIVTVGSTQYKTNAVGSTYYDRVANGTGTNSKTRTSAALKGWRIPSVTDWRYIFQGLGGPSATSPVGVGSGNTYPYGNKDELYAAINKACLNSELHQDDYWSSSELTTNSGIAWYYLFHGGYFYNYNKTYTRYVRAGFAW